MKFLLDAQLPLALKTWLKGQGHDVVHTLDLPQKNLTHDSYIIDLSVAEDRILITKDSDFFDHFTLKGTPPKLLMITTGNIVNKELISLFQLNFEKVADLLQQYAVIEMNNTDIIVHY